MNTLLTEIFRIAMMRLITGEVSLQGKLMLSMVSTKRKVEEHIFFVLKDKQLMTKMILCSNSTLRKQTGIKRNTVVEDTVVDVRCAN